MVIAYIGAGDWTLISRGDQRSIASCLQTPHKICTICDCTNLPSATIENVDCRFDGTLPTFHFHALRLIYLLIFCMYVFYPYMVNIAYSRSLEPIFSFDISEIRFLRRYYNEIWLFEPKNISDISKTYIHCLRGLLYSELGSVYFELLPRT